METRTKICGALVWLNFEPFPLGKVAQESMGGWKLTKQADRFYVAAIEG